MAQTYNKLGTAYAKNGELDRAVEMYAQSLETNERLDDLPGMAHTCRNLGAVCTPVGEWDRAIETWRRSLRTFEELGDFEGMASCYTNLGLACLQMGQGDAAKPLLGQACLILSWLGSDQADDVFEMLVDACGSEEAANAYLEQLPDGPQRAG